jgi:hypothetical protein
LADAYLHLLDSPLASCRLGFFAAGVVAAQCERAVDIPSWILILWLPLFVPPAEIPSQLSISGRLLERSIVAMESSQASAMRFNHLDG